MQLGIDGKVALVLGAGGGLGGAIAKALSREGVKVAAASRHLASAQATCEALAGAGLALAWDLGDLAAIEANVSRVEVELGPVDILVNNTGGPPPTTAAGQASELWAGQFQAMVLSVIALTDRVLPGMRARRWGRVITSTSAGVVTPLANLALSNALRLSLVGWSKTLAREVAAEGVTVNIVAPGRIATARVAFLDEARAKRETRPIEAIRAESAASIPAGRYGAPEEYGDVVAFLASDRAAYVTGSTVRVDGGLIPSI